MFCWCYFLERCKTIYNIQQNIIISTFVVGMRKPAAYSYPDMATKNLLTMVKLYYVNLSNELFKKI